MMMKCPSCNRPVAQQTQPDGSTTFACNHCGWGKTAGEAFADDTPSREIAPGAWLKLAGFWLLSLVVILGPYLALRFGLPYWLGAKPYWAQIGPKLLPLLDVHYWWVMLVYLVLGNLITPSWDPDNMGLFGTSIIDNPFSHEDDWNRSMRNIAFLMAPAKLVWATVLGTWRMLRA